tara:strand:- start:4105 stop:4392 length:288 start_codon:yes stop_codon:yes gene_type:complete
MYTSTKQFKREIYVGEAKELGIFDNVYYGEVMELNDWDMIPIFVDEIDEDEYEINFSLESIEQDEWEDYKNNVNWDYMTHIPDDNVRKLQIDNEA